MDPQEQIAKLGKAFKGAKAKGLLREGWQKTKRFVIECRRVLKVTKKPDKEEFQTIVKISALGMGVIGIVGFIIHIIKEVIL
jgi:protein transport protein SEC61 subunit gamma and related proteins